MKALRSYFRMTIVLCGAAEFVLAFRALALLSGGNVQQMQSPFTDYRHEQPGTKRRITIADLPGTVPHSVGGQPPAPHRTASGCLAESAAGIQINAIRSGPTLVPNGDRIHRSVGGADKTGAPYMTSPSQGWRTIGTAEWSDLCLNLSIWPHSLKMNGR